MFFERFKEFRRFFSDASHEEFGSKLACAVSPHAVRYGQNEMRGVEENFSRVGQSVGGFWVDGESEVGVVVPWTFGPIDGVGLPVGSEDIWP